MVTNTLKIEQGSCRDIASFPELLEEHWIELAKNKNLMELSPNVEMYARLEEMGCLFSLIAKYGDTPVGYSMNVLSYHGHYSKLYYCHNDLIFVAKAYRNTPVGGRLILATEREAVKRGAKFMTWHAKEDTALANILPKIGCKRHEIVFSKEL